MKAHGIPVRTDIGTRPFVTGYLAVNCLDEPTMHDVRRSVADLLWKQSIFADGCSLATNAMTTNNFSSAALGLTSSKVDDVLTVK